MGVTPKAAFILILLALAASQVNASFVIEQGVHIAFHDSADLITGSDMTFSADTITYGNGSINLGAFWFNSTTDLTLTAFFSANWFNYTVSANGTQTLYNSTHRPVEVRIDAVNAPENSGWNYSAGMLTVYNASSSVAMLFIPSTLGDPFFAVTVGLTISGTAGALVYFYRRSAKKRSKVIEP